VIEPPTSAEDYPAEDYPAPNTTNELDLGDLPDVPDDADEAAAGAAVDDSWAETLEDDSPGAH
jgi:hypothetical protein